jgi:hypothetical protein
MYQETPEEDGAIVSRKDDQQAGKQPGATDSPGIIPPSFGAPVSASPVPASVQPASASPAPQVPASPAPQVPASPPSVSRPPASGPSASGPEPADFAAPPATEVAPPATEVAPPATEAAPPAFGMPAPETAPPAFGALMAQASALEAAPPKAGAAVATSAVAFPPDAGPHLPPAPSEPMPEPDDGSTVGWYPSTPVGPPAAGPFAASARPPRRGVGRLGLAGAASRPVTWGRGRGRLANILLFGFGPLLLAGVIVAAFVLVSPGKGTATSPLGFQAGPAASTSAAPSASPSLTGTPSSSPTHARQHPRGAPSASAKVPTIVAPKAKTTSQPKPKPKRKSGPSGGVVPHNLGQPNFAGYCQHIGHRTAELTASNAYGWHCALYPTRVLEITSVCAWTYGLSTSQVISVSTNYSDPEAWQCWRINRDLGVLNVTQYCVGAGLGTSELVADNAYGWDCTKPVAAVNITAACDAVYNVSDAVARFAVFADPYSWQCWN